MYTTEENKICPIINAGSYHSAGKKSAGVRVGRAHHVTVIISAAAQTDGNARITTWTGTTHDADNTASIIKPPVYGNGAAPEVAAADTFTAVSYVDSANYWLLPATDNRTYVIEIPGQMIPAGHDWLGINIGDEGAGTAINLVVAIVYPRYKPSQSVMRS